MSELYQKQASSIETSRAHQAWFTVIGVTGYYPYRQPGSYICNLNSLGNGNVLSKV